MDLCILKDFVGSKVLLAIYLQCNQEADTTLTLANVVKPTSVSWEQRATSNILKGGTQWRVIQLKDHLESKILSSFTLKKVTGSTVTGLKISVLQTGQCNILFPFHYLNPAIFKLKMRIQVFLFGIWKRMNSLPNIRQPGQTLLKQRLVGFLCKTN